MKNKMKKMTVALAVICFMGVTNATVSEAAICHKNAYRTTACSSCDDSTYNSTQVDTCTAKHPRQNGIKLCSTHLSAMSSKASYYKRGFSDYNCLAYNK